MKRFVRSPWPYLLTIALVVALVWVDPVDPTVPGVTVTTATAEVTPHLVTATFGDTHVDGFLDYTPTISVNAGLTVESNRDVEAVSLEMDTSAGTVRLDLDRIDGRRWQTSLVGPQRAHPSRISVRWDGGSATYSLTVVAERDFGQGEFLPLAVFRTVPSSLVEGEPEQPWPIALEIEGLGEPRVVEGSLTVEVGGFERTYELLVEACSFSMCRIETGSPAMLETEQTAPPPYVFTFEITIDGETYAPVSWTYEDYPPDYEPQRLVVAP